MKRTLIYIRHPWRPRDTPPHPGWQVWMVTRNPGYPEGTQGSLRITEISRRVFVTFDEALRYARNRRQHLAGRGYQRERGPEEFLLDESPHPELPYSDGHPWPRPLSL